jgi:hypothetical protein
MRIARLRPNAMFSGAQLAARPLQLKLEGA